MLVIPNTPDSRKTNQNKKQSSSFPLRQTLIIKLLIPGIPDFKKIKLFVPRHVLEILDIGQIELPGKAPVQQHCCQSDSLRREVVLSITLWGHT